MGYHAAILVCGSRSPRWNFLFWLLEYEILSLCSFETSGSTHLATHCHITEHLVANHTSGSSPNRTGPQHELREHFSFFISLRYLRKDFLTPRHSRISPMSLRAWLLWNSLREPDLWKFLFACTFHIDKFTCLTSEPSHVQLFGYNVIGRCFLTEKNN